MERISTKHGIKLILFFLIFLSVVVSAQNDCMGSQSVVVNPPPSGGGYAPGTIVTYCVTYNNWNTNIGTNWLEGFDLTIGAGWDLSTLTPTQLPGNLNGGGGQWLWIPNTFNGNPTSSGGAGNQFGPGFFFDLNNNGQSVDDWGDFGTGPWTFCFQITVGNSAGSSLSMQVSPVSDGYAGSWGTPGCNGEYQFQLSPGNIVLGCLNPPVINLISVTDATCQGFSNGSINVGVINGTSPYAFYLDGNPVVFPVNNLSPGPYVVTCEDDDACLSNVLNVTVGENTPVVNNTINVINNLCFNESNGSFEITSNGGQTPYTYTLNGISQLTGVYSNMSSGNHTVVISDNNGCTYNQNVVITEPTDITNLPTITTNLLCYNDNIGTIQVTANGGTPPYLYQLGSITNNTGFFDNLGVNTYTVQITDDNGCTHMVANINISGPNMPLQGQITMTEPTCFGDNDGNINTQIQGGTSPYTYIWSVPTPNNMSNLIGYPSGFYQVTVSDNNLCDVTLSTTMTQPDLVSLQGNNLTQVCYGFPVDLTVSESNSVLPYTIQWSNSFDATIQGNNTTSIPPTTSQYTALLTDANGCTASHIFNAIVNSLPDPSFSESDVTGCTPKCIDFQINNPQPNFNYLWSIGESSTFNGQSISNCYDNEGIFTVKVIATSTKGCVDSLTKQNLIIINKTPIAAFSILGEKQRDILNPYFEFYNLSQDGDSYIWKFDDGDSSLIENPSHRYLEPGEYCVNLVTSKNYVTGIPFCRDTVDNCVLINPLSVLYIPNSFSPNNDGINDQFKVYSSRITYFEIRIFDRWSEVLYTSYDFDSYWDGMYNGTILPNGVYYYEVLYRDIKERINQIKGTVTLLR